MSVEQEILAEVKGANLSRDEFFAVYRRHYRRLCSEYEEKFGETVPEWYHGCKADPCSMCSGLERHIENGVRLISDEENRERQKKLLERGYRQHDGGIVYGADWLTE